MSHIYICNSTHPIYMSTAKEIRSIRSRPFFPRFSTTRNTRAKNARSSGENGAKSTAAREGVVQTDRDQLPPGSSLVWYWTRQWRLQTWRLQWPLQKVCGISMRSWLGRFGLRLWPLRQEVYTLIEALVLLWSLRFTSSGRRGPPGRKKCSNYFTWGRYGPLLLFSQSWSPFQLPQAFGCLRTLQLDVPVQRPRRRRWRRRATWPSPPGCYVSIAMCGRSWDWRKGGFGISPCLTCWPMNQRGWRTWWNLDLP